MKILSRNYRHRNLILFLILSLVYLQAISSLSNGHTIFSTQSLRLFFKEHLLIFIVSFLCSFMIINLKKYSEIILLICLGVIVGKSFILLSASFNKLTLGFNFIYLVFAFYFFISWELEVGLASFNPMFSSHDLEKEPRFKLRGRLGKSDNQEDAIDVHITNIDEESCFVLLPQDSKFNYTSTGKYFLTAEYDGVYFTQQANLVSSYDRGLGFIFESNSNKRLSWSELYKVCLERGLVS